MKSTFEGAEGLPWIEMTEKKFGYIKSMALSNLSIPRDDPPPCLDDLYSKFPAMFPEGFTLEDTRGFDLDKPFYQHYISVPEVGKE